MYQPETHYLPEGFCLKVDNGRGLIQRLITKVSWHNLFTTNSNPLLTATRFQVKIAKNVKGINNIFKGDNLSFFALYGLFLSS